MRKEEVGENLLMLIVVEAPSTLLLLYITGLRPPLLSAQHPLNYSAAAFNSAASASSPSQYLHHPHHPPTATTFSLRKKKTNKSISSGAQYVTLQRYFSHSSFSYLPFSNPTHKTKTGTANRWESTNTKPPEPIIIIGQSKTGSSSQIIFICTLLSRSQALQCLSLASAQSSKYAGPKPFC